MSTVDARSLLIVFSGYCSNAVAFACPFKAVCLVLVDVACLFTCASLAFVAFVMCPNRVCLMLVDVACLFKRACFTVAAAVCDATVCWSMMVVLMPPSLLHECDNGNDEYHDDSLSCMNIATAVTDADRRMAGYGGEHGL